MLWINKSSDGFEGSGGIVSVVGGVDCVSASCTGFVQWTNTKGSSGCARGSSVDRESASCTDVVQSVNTKGFPDCARGFRVEVFFGVYRNELVRNLDPYYNAQRVY